MRASKNSIIAAFSIALLVICLSIIALLLFTALNKPAEVKASTRIILLGGSKDESSIESFNPDASDTEPKLLQTLLTPRAGARAELFQNKIYLLGGIEQLTIGDVATEYLRSTSIIDLSTWEEHPGPPLNSKRGFPGSVILQNTIFICGGSSSDSFDRLHSCEKLNLESKSPTWTAIEPMLAERSGLAMVVYSNKIIALGGCWTGGSDCITAESYNVAEDRWTELPHMYNSRIGLAAAVLGDKVWACGGYGRSGSDFRSCEVFDPQEETWSLGSEMNRARYCLTMVNFNGKLVALGDDDARREKSLEIYQPSLDSWTESPVKLVIGRCYSASVVI